MEKLVNECKEAFKSGDLETASKLWNELYKMYAPTPEELKNNPDSEEINKKMNYFANSMNNFTDNEVYKITEYIKSKEN